MGYRHSKDEILEAAVAFVLEEGLSRLTFGAVASRIGISDRIVVYYFPSKDDLIVEVLRTIGDRLQDALGPSLSTRVPNHVEFVRAVWPSLTNRRSDSVFAVFFEASGLASAGIEPYRSLAPALVNGWIAWAEESIDGNEAHRREQAAAAIATIDGLLLLRRLSGPTMANRAQTAIVGRGRRAR
jgi:AcrR family transcriptional regulator